MKFIKYLLDGSFLAYLKASGFDSTANFFSFLLDGKFLCYLEKNGFSFIDDLLFNICLVINELLLWVTMLFIKVYMCTL